MLNPIPILFLAPLAYFILRCGVGIILIHIALTLWNRREEFLFSPAPRLTRLVLALLIVGKLTIACLLIVGFYTQYAALALICMSLDCMLARHWVRNDALPPRSFYALMFFVGCSLLITGAGAFAVDLPI